jgi:hypothetical protein
VTKAALTGKQLEIGVELVPGAKKAGMLVNPNSAASAAYKRPLIH